MIRRTLKFRKSMRSRTRRRLARPTGGRSQRWRRVAGLAASVMFLFALNACLVEGAILEQERVEEHETDHHPRHSDHGESGDGEADDCCSSLADVHWEADSGQREDPVRRHRAHGDSFLAVERGVSCLRLRTFPASAAERAPPDRPQLLFSFVPCGLRAPPGRTVRCFRNGFCAFDFFNVQVQENLL